MTCTTGCCSPLWCVFRQSDAASGTFTCASFKSSDAMDAAAASTLAQWHDVSRGATGVRAPIPSSTLLSKDESGGVAAVVLFLTQSPRYLAAAKGMADTSTVLYSLLGHTVVLFDGHGHGHSESSAASGAADDEPSPPVVQTRFVSGTLWRRSVVALVITGKATALLSATPSARDSLMKEMRVELATACRTGLEATGGRPSVSGGGGAASGGVVTSAGGAGAAMSTPAAAGATDGGKPMSAPLSVRVRVCVSWLVLSLRSTLTVPADGAVLCPHALVVPCF